MKLSVHNPASNDDPVWMLPACYAFAAIALQYALLAAYDSSGQIHLYLQELLGLPMLMVLFTTGFWIALQLVYRKLNSAMLGYLLDTNHLSRIGYFRSRTLIRLRNQAWLALVPTFAIYMYQFQGVLPATYGQAFNQLVAIVFWFSIWLFVLQSWCLPNFVYKYFLGHIPDSVASIQQQKELAAVVRLILLLNVATILFLPGFMLVGKYLALVCLIATLTFGCVILHTLNVMAKAGKNGRHFVHNAVTRIDKKLYYLKRKGKYREDILRHAMLRLEAQKTELRGLPVSLLSARLITVLLASICLLFTVWRVTAV